MWYLMLFIYGDMFLPVFLFLLNECLVLFLYPAILWLYVLFYGGDLL